ncbi:MAG: tRNA-dihydrouridine synthase family protein [Thermoplasmata archaeon]|nr:tRNA-dihydrouridine synthase family protein [Thermoplasmata archaeon]
MVGYKNIPEGFQIRRGENIIEVPGVVIAGPMAGVNDPPYRRILHSHGCPLSFTEMLSSRGLSEGNVKTEEFLDRGELPGLVGAQIFGSDPKYLTAAASEVEGRGYPIIDLNAGCPKKKVLAQGSGGGLLRDRENFLNCVSSILESVEVPVGVKTRIGFYDLDEGYMLDLLHDIQELGVSFISVHGRTVKEGFTGRANREIISKISRRLRVPLIASGDVYSPDDVADYLGRGATAVMAARCLMGDPTWIKRCVETLRSGVDWTRYPISPSQVEVHMGILRDHLSLALGHYEERRGCINIRAHMGWYLKPFKGRNLFHDRLYASITGESVLSLIDDMEKAWKSHLAR